MSDTQLEIARKILAEFVADVDGVGIENVRNDDVDDPLSWPDLAYTYDKAKAFLNPVRYTASFDPQAWLNDVGTSVDPEGDTNWDCTAVLKEDIVITSTPKRELRVNQQGADLALWERHDHQSPWLFITAEELAYVMLSASGQFQERYDAELERLQNDKT